MPAIGGISPTSLFAPDGEGSALSMKCAGHACIKMKIHDDWTTEIYMEPFGSDGFSFATTKIKNIFDGNSTLNMSGSDANYIG